MQNVKHTMQNVKIFRLYGSLFFLRLMQPVKIYNNKFALILMFCLPFFIL
ncbi:hypothetical protein MCHI_001530 [Candidatus Magnetoovum chiemensis]|nr:hypothetical protein MCHI_001530 [Candidatus Magnetoovum chiemensis]